MPCHLATHPLLSHKITLLRNEVTQPHDFRRVLKEITFYLGYEATRDLKLSECTIRTPNNVEATGHRISENISFIPILRAGSGMTDGMLDLIPKASIHHIGMYRAKESLMPGRRKKLIYIFSCFLSSYRRIHMPCDFNLIYWTSFFVSIMIVQYYNKLPRGQVCDIAYILDPCIATSGTITATISIVKKWGAKKIVIIAAIGAQKGVDEVLSKHPDVDIHIAAIDSVLSSEGMIIPGLGDAGDRQFCTPDYEDTSELSPSKRQADHNHAAGSKKKGKK